MKHAIPQEGLGPRGHAMTSAIEACVHCGFCLPTCPTYVTMQEEMDSPRGRIFLMKEVLEGKLEAELALPYVDNCLGCQACVTACPSGVEYGGLLTAFRAQQEETRHRSAVEHGRRTLVHRTLPYPRRFRAAARLAGSVRRLRRLLPGPVADMVDLVPERLPRARPLPELHPAEGSRRARVALLAGCAQQVLAPGINWSALRVLARNGVETVIPGGQGCCGALAMHAGDADQALSLARRNLAAFPSDVDAVLTTAAGCGSGMREYGLLFAGDPAAGDAEDLAGRVMDITTFLAQLGLATTPPAATRGVRLAYHDACHLAHAQRERSAPRTLLAAIPGVELVEPAEWELCCGSAGTYNIEKPEVARQLGERKARNLLATGAQLVASGNIGCLTQLQLHLEGLGSDLRVAHTIEVLDHAYTSTLEELTTP